ncbi:MAG: hypothetical protein KDC66_02360 [Phaeodactylibacter sp.]|nr:hypothetical protein [Phaeodactylibacter sp.]MCB9272638.1 hypothetical protein [Lewinellaceae bacterium]
MNISEQLWQTRRAWAAALRYHRFLWVVGIFISILLLIGSGMPAFFNYLEQRPGWAPDDPLLGLIPATGLSGPIFGLIYLLLAYIIMRGMVSPPLLLHFLAGYVFMMLARIITLTLVPLEPPVGLIPLIDPGADLFYGGRNVTKDLFFSGHTATAFLIYLCLQERKEKALALGALIALAIMLLIQHIHYTIDVIAAFPITYVCHKLSRQVAAFTWASHSRRAEAPVDR